MLMPNIANNLLYWLISALLSAPFILVYLAYRHTLKGKRLTILQVMQGNQVFESYVNAFIGPAGSGEGQRLKPTSDRQQLSPQLLVDELFNLYYHWRHYSYGIFLNAAIITLVTAATLKAQGLPLSFPAPLAHAPLTMTAAFAGAYIWNLYDLVGRYRTVDLTPAAFQFSWIRLLTACVAGPLAGAAVTEGLKPLVSFGVGLIPLQTIFQYFTGYAQRKLDISTQETPVEGPTLHHLEGMTRSVITRLGEEGIDSVRALSYSDPVKLFLKTDFEWALIIDFIDQGLLFNYIGDKLKALGLLGIEGSIDMGTIYSRLMENEERTDSSSPTATADAPERKDALDAISCIAERIGVKKEEAKNLLRMIYEDIQVEFIWNIVGGYDDDNDKEAVERVEQPTSGHGQLLGKTAEPHADDPPQ